MGSMSKGRSDRAVPKADWSVEETGCILGAHLVEPHADEVINILGLAIRHGLTARDLKSMIFDYPTGASDIGSML